MAVEHLPVYFGVSFAFTNIILVGLIFPTGDGWWYVVGVGLVSLGAGYFGGRLGLWFFRDRRVK